MFANYFPDTEKRKLQDKLRKLRQGDRTVGEYEREFSHIIDCVPNVVRDDRDRADWFLRVLQLRIYEKVQILKLTTFAEVLDRALWAEHGSTYARGERESMDKERDKGKKQAAGGAGGRSNAKKLEHRPSTCSQREGKCFKCSQPGHLIRECPGWASSAPTAASVPSSPRQLAGLPPAMSAGRASAPRQPKRSRAPSGRVFATQVEEQPAVPDGVVADIILIRGTRARAFVTSRDRYQFGPVRARRTDAERTGPPLSAQG
uniref:CCHC-type domain-containing protein n=1 Tax=Ananas comosus var. bracteatus TaxID=296719 RepID=A0A6V7Q236_ANACO|nr:unnamed protein product [Ananas comosus var. bracteatus]